jgi:hypothetical protein
MPRNHAFPPRLLPVSAASHYLGISESMLPTLRLPRREIGAKRLYDIQDLDAWADEQSYEGPQERGRVSRADEAFGL